MPKSLFSFKRKTGVGPATSTLARWRSTTELFPQIVAFTAIFLVSSGKRESDPRHPPWQGGALPLSYFRKINSVDARGGT